MRGDAERREAGRWVTTVAVVKSRGDSSVHQSRNGSVSLLALTGFFFPLKDVERVL